MAKAITVRGLALGEGRPKICVPLVAPEQEGLLTEAKAALAAGAEVVEWRADFLVDTQTELNTAARVVGATAEQLRQAVGDTPLLCTMRSREEGGQCAIGDEATAYLLETAARTGAIDLLDIELGFGEDTCGEVIETAKGQGVKTVLSHHRFDETPDTAYMLGVLRVCETLGADIAKLAVMPKVPTDVLALLSVTDTFHRTGGIPAITMSMGPLGAISRLCGEAFGSCLTFGAGKNASAPGQIEARALAGMLDALGLEE